MRSLDKLMPFGTACWQASLSACKISLK